MPVPTLITDLSTTALSNSPQGTDTAKGSIDDYFRSHASFIATLRDGGAQFLQVGTGAVARSHQDKMRESFSVLDFMSDAERADYRAGTLLLDHTVSYQKALTAASAVGGDVFAPDGLAKITTRLDVTGNNVKLRLSHYAGISYDTPDYMAIKFSGSGCSVEGGMGRGFIGPSVWDGANVTPTYAVIQFLGDNCKASTRLQTVKKVGIWFKDCIDGTAESCRIDGNYPSGSWTGVETVNYGILFDASNTTTAGNFKALGNTIKSCVQGIMAANYGSGPLMTLGFVATGNIFEGMFNHGIYSNFTGGAVVTGNSFNRCQISAVLSGDKNVFSGNAVYTAATAAGDERDVVGLSIRDGSGNTITGNTFRGVLTTASSVCISVQDVNSLYPLNDNVIEANTIEITDGAGIAIRINGTAQAVNRNIIANNTIKCPGKASEGAISVYGKSGALNLGNKIHHNSILLSALSWGVAHQNLTAANVHNNTIEYAWDAASASSVVTIAAINATNCTASENTSAVRPTFGANLTIYGYREFTAASNNTARNNIDAVDTSHGAAYVPLLPLASSGLLIDQSGTGVPTYDSRVGSRWWRTDGAAGSTFYVREVFATPTVWTAK